MDVYACDPVMPVLPVVAMRGSMTQPSPPTVAVPVRGPREPARLAQAAWAVTSAGAEVTDRVVLLVRELMEAAR